MSIIESSLKGPSFIFNEKTVKKAIILLHGFGSDGQDMLGLIPALENALPQANQGQTAYFCPNGPLILPEFGYAWFSDKSWTFRDRTGIENAKNLLWAYIEAHIFPLGLQAKDITVIGFSQGAMTALFATPRWPEQIGGVISHSGIAMWQEELDVKTCHKPPILLLHGIDDDVVPADQTVAAAQGLQALGFKTQTHLIENLAHGINEESLEKIIRFLE